VQEGEREGDGKGEGDVHESTAALAPRWTEGIRQSARYAIIGLMDGAMSHHWYIWVDSVVLDSGLLGVVKKVAWDQVLLTPVWATGFITILAVLEGKGPRGIVAKLKSDWFSVCYESNLFWVGANAVNYWLVPLEHRVLGFCIATFIFTVYLSFTKSPADEDKGGGGGGIDLTVGEGAPSGGVSVAAIPIPVEP